MQFAIFDLDHTLLPMDSGDSWTHFIINATGAEREALAAKAVEINEGYRQGTFDPEDAIRFQMGLLCRFARAELFALREQFLQEFVWPSVRPEAQALVDDRRQAGFTPVLASGTHRFVTAPIAERFGIEYLVAATPQVDSQGNFTGRVQGSHSYREGKLRLLEQFLAPAAKAGPLALEGYSDSINDLPMLQYVAEKGGRAVAVHPDRALQVQAKARGWEIMTLFAKEDL